MVKIIGPETTWWTSTIFDQHSSLQMAIRQVSDIQEPIMLEIDGCEWPLTLEDATGYVRAARSLSRAIDNAERNKVTPTPKAYIQHTRTSDTGVETLLELATVSDFSYLSVAWGDVRLFPPPTKRDEILWALGERMAEIVQAMRGDARSGQWGEDALAGAPRGRTRAMSSPAPGTRWLTSRPRSWSDPEVGPPGW